MNKSVKQWLLKTIWFQSTLFVGLTVMWLFFALLVIVEKAYYGVWELLILLSILGWAYYVLLQLYRNIRATNAFRTSEQTIDWQKAMQYQLVFWKHVTFVTLLYVLWMLFVLGALMVLGGWSDLSL